MVAVGRLPGPPGWDQPPAYHSPRRASRSATTSASRSVEPTSSTDNAMASSVETPTPSRARSKPRPLTVARPIRRLVNEPGPVDTPMASRSSTPRPSLERTASIVGRSADACCRLSSLSRRTMTSSSRSRATESQSVEDSIARSVRVMSLGVDQARGLLWTIREPTHELQPGGGQVIPEGPTHQ